MLQVQRDQQVLQERQAHKVRKETQEIRVLQVQRDQQEPQVLQEHKVQPVQRVLPERQV